MTNENRREKKLNSNSRHFFFQCNNGGCLVELAQQLAVIMIGKQMINNAQEVIIPKAKAWWHSKKVRSHRL